MMSRAKVRVSASSALLLAFTFLLISTASAQEICSNDGRAKMKAGGVAEQQIAKICPPVAGQGTQGQSMSLDDLRLDFESLVGKRVAVKASGVYMMDMFMIRKSEMDANPISVDIKGLGREQRRQILQRCSDVMSGCRVTVVGVVDKGSFQKKIVAESVGVQ